MTATIVLLVAGCALILIGLVGGGVTSKWLNVGKVSGPARGLAVILGLVLICAGIAIQLWPHAPAGKAKTSPNATASAPASQPLPQPTPIKEPLKKTPAAPVAKPITITISLDLSHYLDKPTDDATVVFDKQTLNFNANPAKLSDPKPLILPGGARAYYYQIKLKRIWAADGSTAECEGSGSVEVSDRTTLYVNCKNGAPAYLSPIPYPN